MAMNPKGGQKGKRKHHRERVKFQKKKNSNCIEILRGIFIHFLRLIIIQ